MKNLLKFLSAVFIILTLASCEKKQDWTCICQYPFSGDAEENPWWIVSTTVIMDSKEKDAIIECDFYDSALLGLTYDCALE